MKFEWESISETQKHTTCRAKVHGGWIINCLTNVIDNSGYNTSESMVFIPDPKHEWTVEK